MTKGGQALHDNPLRDRVTADMVAAGFQVIPAPIRDALANPATAGVRWLVYCDGQVTLTNYAAAVATIVKGATLPVTVIPLQAR